jgi:ubiquinone biosynthesis protein
MLVEEFGRSIRRELDFVAEGATLARFNELFAGDEAVRVPRVHWDLTGRDVLVMERLDGVRLTDRERLRESGTDLAALGERVAKCFMRQFFEFGLFHADPHPGNVLVLEGGRLGLLDLGAAGHLTERMRGQLALTLLALSRGEIELILDVYAEIGVFPEDVEPRDLAPDVQDLIDRYYGVPAGRIDMRAAFEDAVRLAQRRAVVLPREFVMLGRSFVLASAVVQDLAPDYDLASAVRPYVRRLIAGQLRPRSLLRRTGLALYDLVGLVRSLPRDLRDIVRKVRAGHLAVTLRHAGLDELAREIDRASNRLAFAIVIASVVVGSALLLSNEIGPTIRVLQTDLSAVGLAGFLFAGALGLILAWGIWRSGKV